MPLHSRLHAILNQPLDKIRAHDVLAESLLLKQLQVTQRRARISQVFEIRRPAPVLQVGEVGDKRGLGEEFLRREVVEVEWVCEGLNKLWRVSVFCPYKQASKLFWNCITSSSISKRE